ncbi:ferredoxin-NADPH reductase [Nonomuraea candida]|uniref:ferredoxin-NADPH reductase n=1 Tax=Nonomuraea candida TaxID=359159 RepID=UPI000ADA0F67|nr:ferredoxin-NADPH reductase [Nonomuraea candida]
MSAPGQAGGVRRWLRPAAQTTYERIFGTVYVGLMTNVLLAAACAPLLAALAILRDPWASWPFFLALSPLCAPALTGAFACFAALGEPGAAVVLRPFLTGYRRGGGRAALVWAGGAAAVAVLAIDTAAVWRTGWGPALVPFFATAAGLVIAVTVALLTLLAEGEPVRLRACLYLVARRWYLAALNVAALGLAVTVVLARPVLGVLLLGAPLLYLVWATTRFVLAPLLPAHPQR